MSKHCGQTLACSKYVNCTSSHFQYFIVFLKETPQSRLSSEKILAKAARVCYNFWCYFGADKYEGNIRLNLGRKSWSILGLGWTLASALQSTSRWRRSLLKTSTARRSTTTLPLHTAPTGLLSPPLLLIRGEGGPTKNPDIYGQADHTVDPPLRPGLMTFRGQKRQNLGKENGKQISQNTYNQARWRWSSPTPPPLRSAWP